MAEINYSLEGLDSSIAAFGASASCWTDKKSPRTYKEGSGGTPDMAHSIVDAQDDVHHALGRLASSTKAFLESAKTLMMKADETSPFEG